MATKKIKVGIIGAGDISRNQHIPAYKKFAEVDLAALCDVNRPLAEKLAAESGISKVYDDPAKMLAAEKPDAVSICTPNWLHAPQTIMALKAGCHVLCEKPMALNVRDAQKMAATAKQTRKILMIPFRTQFTTRAQHLKKIIAKGELGRIDHVKTGWLGDQPSFGGKWFVAREKSGGGPVIDRGVYLVNAVLWLLGNPEVVSISASTSNLIGKRDPGFGVEDMAGAFIRLKNGATVFIEVSYMLNGTPGAYMFLHGDKGGAEWVIFGDIFGARPPVTIFTRKDGKPEPQTPDIKISNAFENIIAAFLSAIKTGKQPPASGWEGLYGAKVLEGIYESARRKKEIAVRIKFVQS